MTDSDSALAVAQKLEELYTAIRYMRDQRGDDRCWLDLEKLYKLLPEGYTPPERDIEIELENCKQYLKCMRNPNTEYVSPQREIERLNGLVQLAKSNFEKLSKLVPEHENSLQYNANDTPETSLCKIILRGVRRHSQEYLQTAYGTHEKATS